MDAPFPEGLAEDMERVIREDREPRGLDSYVAIFEAPLVFPLQRRRELEWMIREARIAESRVVVEIGADKGGGCYHWLKSLEPTHFCGIEIRGVPHAAALAQAFGATEQLWLGASSFSPATIGEVRRWLDGRQIDVLFIDGDKSRFLEDFAAYLPQVRQGGLVLMHDVQDRSPGEAFQKARQHPRVSRSQAFIDTSEAREAIEREHGGAPPANPHEGWLRHWRGTSCGVGALWC